ncbi:MAG: DUF4864 domain-containing protein, partial [Proteobacteria bacterium]|nr:DUF4864 domain-containing protein [Pseudomonadota bacterium]
MGKPGNFLAELKRRNVVRVAFVYGIVAWLLLQIVDIVAPLLELPDWVGKFFLLLIVIGFPLALIFAWAFEMTPDGLKLEKHVDRSQSVTAETGRKLDFMIIAVLLFTLPAVAQSLPSQVGEADRQAIRMVIEEQLGAFQRDDAVAAFAQASPNIQAMFQTPDRFMDMVRGGYRPVYRPRRVEFRDIIDLDGVPTQRVFIIGPDGAPVMALYPMELQA